MTATHDAQMSVIVPVRNREKLVVETLDSIKRQTYRPLNLVIVDNDSTDDTLEVVNKWAEVNDSDDFTISVLSELRKGATYARNLGLGVVTTPYVMFFDSDDEMLPDHIERVMALFNQFPNLDLIYFDVAILDEDGWLIKRVVRDSEPLRAHLFHSTLATLRMALRTEFVRSVGGWNEECTSWNDLELGIRLLLANPRMRRLPGDPRVIIHPTADSITGTSYNHRSAMAERVLDIIEQGIPSTMPWAKPWVDAKRMVLAANYRREGAKEKAKSLRERTLAGKNLSTALRLRLVYITTRFFGHGGCSLAATFFPGPKREKQ